MATKATLEKRIAALEARLAQASKVGKAKSTKARATKAKAPKVALPARSKRGRELFMSAKAYILAAPTLAEFDARMAEHGGHFLGSTPKLMRDAYTKDKARTPAAYRAFLAKR